MKLVLMTMAALGLAAACLAQELPAATEVWAEVPRVTPAAALGEAPADAIVLFNGRDATGWESVNDTPARWTVTDGALVVGPGTGDIRTTENFGDVQLHIEWRTPVLPASNTGQDRGNSGVFLAERYEVQILDTLENSTYANGQAGSIYKQHIPLVNAARPGGEWQAYDIIYIAPRFAEDGSLQSPARLTVFLNGVLIQHDVTLSGTTTYLGQPRYEAHGDAPIRLQDHGHLVAFRNIWARRL